MNNLVITVLGNRNSGKSTTWNNLFGQKVKTGNRLRRLYLRPKEYVEVFLVSGSPEERGKYVGKIIGESRPRIILCSVQYTPGGIETFDFFNDNGYSIYCQWLNPGRFDSSAIQVFDNLGLMNYLLSFGSLISVQNGKTNPEHRVQIIKEQIYGWAKFRNLVLN